MDFGFTRQQEMLRDMVREFAQNELAPRVSEFEEPEGDWPYDVQRRMGELGLIGLVFPKEMGGNEMGHVALMIAWEEISKVYPTWGSHLRGFILPAYAISRYGPEWAQKELVPKVCRGEMQADMTLTEDVGGSDMAAIRTTATKEGDYFIINGRKIMQSRYTLLDFYTPITRTGERSYTYFIVMKGTPGVELGRREDYISCMTKTYPCGEIIFNNVRVPKENVIGEEGRGFRPVLAAVGAIGRLGGAGVALGAAESAYELALKYAKHRHLYGKPLADIQVLRWWLVDMSTQIEAAKYLCYYPSWLLDQGKRPGEIAAEVARAKAFACEVAVDVCLKAIELHGAYGTAPEYGLILRLKSALDLVSAAGTNQVMRRTIAEAIIGE